MIDLAAWRIKDGEAGVFHQIPSLDDSRLMEIFAREVLSFLVGWELLSPEWLSTAIHQSQRFLSEGSANNHPANLDLTDHPQLDLNP